MERRKRKSAMENYLDSLTDPPEKLTKMAEFYNGVKTFYRKKWNAPLKLPSVQGVEINLYRLFDSVMALGGWLKVSQGEKWVDVAEMMGVGEEVLNGDYAIKLLYMRYLSKYEQNETIGDIDDMMDSEFRGGRGRNISFFATNDCPISMGSRHDFIRRDDRGNPSQEPDYSRVFKSLLSGLPNETDFGFNICTLLSHPGPRLLRLSHAPHLPILLAAHCGIFDEGNCDLSELYENWEKITRREYFAFWANSGAPKEFLDLFVPQALKEHVDKDGEILHGITLEYDVRSPMSWRINQVVNIIRNFSFEPINRVTLSECWPVMKLLFLCASSKWVPLYTAALDTLSNLSSDLNLSSHMLETTAHHALMRVLHAGLESTDKFKLIRCMEILTGLCSFEGNEAILNDFISAKMLERIFDVVCIKDIMMCVYALECLYQMSEMGDVACDLMCKEPKFIQQLVSMATLEAVSFGPAGLAGMKVVEYQPQNQFAHGPPHGHYQMQNVPPGHPAQSGHPQSAHHSYTPGPRAVYVQTPQRPAQPGHMPPPSLPHSSAPPPSAAKPACAPTPGGPPGNAKIEQLTEQWIRQNCVWESNCATPRGELYAAYVDDLRNQYHSLSGTLVSFCNQVKSIFSEVQFRMADNNLLMVVQGVRLNRPHKLAPSTFHTTPQPQSSASQAANNAAANTAIRDILKAVPPAVDPVPVPASSAPVSSTPIPATNGINGKCNGSKRSRSNSPVEEKPVIAKKRSNGVRRSESKSEETDEKEVKPTKIEMAEKVAVEEKEKEDEEEETSNIMMCEWDGCGKTFSTSTGIIVHCSKEHMTDEAQPCKWPGCDGTTRSKWSLVTHIQDHHAQEHQLKAAAQKRKDGTSPATPAPYRTDVQRDTPHHPGYSRHAAYDAIRRHAFNYLPRDITDEPEGPVTKSIRLTSCLILRNMARYSAEGRHLLRRHERHLCWLALSRLESSHALAQLLSELHQETPSEMGEDSSAATQPSPMEVAQYQYV